MAINSDNSAIRVPVITTPPNKLLITNSNAATPSPSPQAKSSSPLCHSENPLEGLPNGLPHSSTSPDSANPSNPSTPTKSGGSKPKTPQTPKSPLTLEVNLDPSLYKYLVEYMSGSDPRVTVKPNVLSRPKGALVPTRLKIFLRNATFRSSDKHPFAVKVDLIL